jgi:hypothetical protein
MQPIAFWPFVLHSLAKSATESADFFELKMRAILIGFILVILGFGLLFLLEGPDVTRQEFRKYLILVPVPAILFLAALFLVNAFRAPYLINAEEFNKASARVTAAENDKTAAERDKRTAESKIQELENKLAQRPEQPPAHRPAAPVAKSISFSDGQRIVLIQKLQAYKGNAIRLVQVGSDAQSNIFLNS